MQAKAKLRLVAPTHNNRTMPGRPANAGLRTRQYLTPHEIEKLIKAARKSGKTDAQGQRNATLELVAYRHGLRAQERCDLEWSHLDWKAATLHVRRVKSGKPVPGAFLLRWSWAGYLSLARRLDSDQPFLGLLYSSSNSPSISIEAVPNFA